MNSTFLLLALAGGRLGPNTLSSLAKMREETFNKWAAFIRMIVALIVTGYLKWRGVPSVKDAAGGPVYSDQATQELITKFWEEKQSGDLWLHGLRGAADFLIELLRPSALEMTLLSSMMSLAGNGSTPSSVPQTVVVNQTPKPTARQVRMSGGRAQGVMVFENGQLYVE